MDPTETVEDYYEALRRGEPLYPYFAEREDAVKFGVGERLSGYDAIAEGLREQSRTTEEWRVESRQLRVIARESVARFTDDVTLSWTDDEGTRRSFDTRWSGVLERVGEEDEKGEGEAAESVGDEDEPEWRFVQMHVSAPRDL